MFNIFNKDSTNIEIAEIHKDKAFILSYSACIIEPFLTGMLSDQL